jgi:hypothetical protein
MNQRFKCKTKTIELSEVNTGINLYDLGLDDGFYKKSTSK